MSRSTSRAHAGSSSPRSVRAGQAERLLGGQELHRACSPRKSMKALASSAAGCRRRGPTASSMTGVPLFGKTYWSGEPRSRSRSVSGRSQIVMRPSCRTIFSYSRMGLKTYSLVCASRRASHAKPAVGRAGLADGFRRGCSPRPRASCPRRADRGSGSCPSTSGRAGRPTRAEPRRPQSPSSCRRASPACGRGRSRDRRRGGCRARSRRPTPDGRRRAGRRARRARRSCRARRTRRRPAGSPSRSAGGRRPPASPCRASGRRRPGARARTPSPPGRGGPGRGASRGRAACARRAGRRRGKGLS